MGKQQSFAWEKYVEEGLAAIPERFRDKIKNVAILLEDEPSAELRKEEGLSEEETLLGYYHGVPLTERGDSYGVGVTLPDTITLFKKPICEEAGDDPAEVRRVVIETIWHEFGHYFGLDEEEVRQREHLRFENEDRREKRP